MEKQTGANGADSGPNRRDLHRIPKYINPVEALRKYRASYNRLSRYEKLISKALLFVATVSLAGAIAEGFQPRKSDRPAQPNRIERLATKYQIGTASADVRQAFQYLLHINPSYLKPAELPQSRIKFGNGIQYSAFLISRNAFSKGLDAKYKVDEYNVAQDLIPEKTQVALERSGYNLTPISPVYCDLAGEQNPLDYSNSLSKDFAVRPSKVDGRQITLIPLGGPLIKSTDNPLDFEKHLFADSFGTPCSLYPRIHYPPTPDFTKVVYT